MTTTTLRNRILASAAAVAAFALLGASRANAVVIPGQYIEDSRCDLIPGQTTSHELGDQSTFPINEALQIVVSKTLSTVCVADDGIANDWTIQMTNLTGAAWKDLFFVANFDINVGNADGSVVDFNNAAVLSDAFHIDATGSNNSLVESGAADGIFSPGETWRFLVTNFQHPSGVSPTPGFFSPGAFAGNTSVTTLDTASIIASPVPEPSSLGLIGLGAAAMVLRRRRR